MTKTSNYQLSQWAATDAVKRTDFNADNQKIDAALAAKTEFVKLQDVTLTEKHTGAYILDMSSVDWSAWQYVMLDMEMAGNGTFYLRPNGTTLGNSWSTGTSSKSNAICEITTQYMQRVVFLVWRRADRKACTANLHGMGFGRSDVFFQNIKTMQFQPHDSSHYFDAGTRFTLWGVG